MLNVFRARCSVLADMTTSFDGTARTSSPAGLAVSVWSSPVGWSTAVLRVLCSTVGPSHPMSSGESLPSLKNSAQIAIVQGDISAPEVAGQLVKAAEETGLALRGVVHGAAVIDDQIVAALSKESLDRVWAPKAAGALRLHAATAGRELDWWVGFSSTSSLLGSPGQGAYAAASAWLDALVAWRRASGLPAITINWGQWSDIGVARSLTFSALDPIAPAEGIEALESVLAGDLSRVGVARLRLDRASAAFPEIQQLGYFATLAEELDLDSDDDDWAGPDALRDMDAVEANRVVTARLGARVLAVMGYPKDSPHRREPAVDRTGNGFPDGRADPEHRPRGLRCGAAGGPVVAGRLADRPHGRSRSVNSASASRTTPRARTMFVIEPSSAPQRGSVLRRGER